VWRLRYQRRWPVRRIAMKLGVTHWAVYKLLSRKRPARAPAFRIPPPKPRIVRPASLSGAFNVWVHAFSPPPLPTQRRRDDPSASRRRPAGEGRSAGSWVL